MTNQSFITVFFFLAAKARKDLDFRPIPQDLLLRSSLYQYFAGRRVQVWQRQLESHPLHKRGGCALKRPPESSCSHPSSEIWSVEMKKQKHTHAFIITWMLTGPPAPTRFGWTILCYQRVTIRCGISGMPREHWPFLTMGRPQQKGIPCLWLTQSHKVRKQLTKSHTLALYVPNCIVTNAQTFLSFRPSSYFWVSPTREQCLSVCVREPADKKGTDVHRLYTRHVSRVLWLNYFPQSLIIATSTDTQSVWVHVSQTDNTSFCTEYL